MAQTIKLKRSATQGASPTAGQLELGEVAINTYDGRFFLKKEVSGTPTIMEFRSISDIDDLSITGTLSLTGTGEELRFYEGSNYVGFSAPALSANQIWVLPDADGAAGEALKTDGSGNLTWGTAGDNSFQTISVSGQSDVVADSTSDTLTLVGDGITITTNATTDTITFTGGATISPLTTDLFTAGVSQTDYTLSKAPNSEDEMLVFVEGVYQNKNSYTISGTTLTLDTAPDTGSEVVVHIVGRGVAGTGHTVDSFTGDNSTTDFTLSVNPLTEGNIFVFFDGVYQHKTEFSVSGTTLSFTVAPPQDTDIEVIIPSITDINTVSSADQFDTSAILPQTVTSTTLATTSASTIATHSATTYRTVKYLIQCTQGTDYHATEINLIHDDTTAYISEYGTIFDNAVLGTFDATLSGGNILLQMTPGSATSMTVRVVAMAIPA